MQYYKPNNFEDVIEIANAAEGTVRYLAGGTDVLVQLRSGITTPDVLIDTKSIASAKQITRKDNGWLIGCAVSGAEISEHPELSLEWPGLVEAMDLIGSTQVQGRATLAGNLCNASPAADSVPAMIAAGATVSIISKSGKRTAKVEDIPTGPGVTALQKGEVISTVHIPARGKNGGDAYLRFIPRSEMDIAVVGCGINLRLDGDKIAEARVALGAIAPTALLVEQAAAAIIGTTLDEAALDALAAAASDACNPIDDKRGTVQFRTHVTGVLVKRVAKIAYDRARAF